MDSRRVESFLLRFAVPPDQAPAEIWHGRVQHVGSGAEQAFGQLQDVLTFIREQLPHDSTDRPASEMPMNAD